MKNVETIAFKTCLTVSAILLPLSRRPLLYLLLPSGLIRMALHSTPGSEWTLWITSTLTRTNRTSTGEWAHVCFAFLPLAQRKKVFQRFLTHHCADLDSCDISDPRNRPGPPLMEMDSTQERKTVIRLPHMIKKKQDKRRISKTSFRAAPAVLFKCGYSGERHSVSVTVGEKL